MALSPKMLMFMGAMKQGLANINEADEFYGDLIKNAAVNIGGAAQTATNNFPKDVDAGQEWYKRYLSLIERYGKDKADFIALQTDYLDRQDWDAVSSQTVNMMPTDFKYTGKTEPIDVMNERINKNISGAKNQLNSASSMKGMKRYTDFYLGQVPEEFALDPSKLPETTQVAMTDTERTEAVKGVVLPTSIVSPTTAVMSHIALLNKVGGDVDLAAQTYPVSKEAFLNAKAANTTFDPITKQAMGLVSTQNYEIALAGGNQKLIQAELYNLEQNIDTMKTMITSLTETAGSDAGVSRLANIVDEDTVFLYQGQELKFKNILKLFRKNNKDIPDADLRKLVLEQLDNANATILTRA
jgi:hypothetical protein